MVFHQFDSFESRDHPWAPCDRSSEFPCKGDSFEGRISCFVGFGGMGTRRDRVALPLISNAGGVIVNPSIQIKCAYGDDGSTWRAPGGCYDHWCDPNNPWQKGGDANGGKPCGFGPRDKINHAWHSYDVASMLALYNDHAQPYRSPQFYSGYNELIYDSNEWNHNLPHTIEAFFVVRGAWFNSNGPTVQHHRAFLRRYKLTEDDVPLIGLDPTNWESPFSEHLRPDELTGDSETLSECPEWCPTWTCDGAKWCLAGERPMPCKAAHC